jgi:predicted lipoprotein with Yx(FWY)xxD motif
MKKSSVLIAIVILALLAGGGYALFHKSYKTKTSTVSSSTNSHTTAVNNAVIVTKTNANLGQYLAEPNGQTLYTYGGDSAGVSNCTGSCLSNWPAYQETGSTTSFPSGIRLIKRSDNGELQYTYNGMPLYTFVGDKNGQATGNGLANFSIAKPSAATSSSSSTSSSTSSNW